ncbi:MAG: YjzC family protein [Hyphomicrobiales bacterium]|nr:YjzC family protein [Hyphomicrobiales bacterium]
MAQQYRPGQVVPQSGIYTITHDPAHADMPHEVTVIKGRRFPTCRHCRGISFKLAHAASMSGRSITSRRRMRPPGSRFLLPLWRAA